MRMTHVGVFGVVALVALLAGCGGGTSGGPSPNESPAQAGPQGFTDQIIVKPSHTSLLATYEAHAAEFASRLSADAGLRLSARRQMHGGSHVLALPTALPMADVAEIAKRLSRREDVQYAEPDAILQTMAIPNDALFSRMWHLREPSVAAGGINAVDAWDLTTGDPNLVIAVVDSGVLRHRDFGGRVIAGYDFVSTILRANDGSGRDGDAGDPGDWIAFGETTAFGVQAPATSSWHGTHVAGTIGALGNNGSGIAGINWQSKILPVRVIGKGGGNLSDIADGIAWSAGAPVPGVPLNSTPARVINLSLGGAGTCTATMQNAINSALARNAVVVVAAGNERSNVASAQPANCTGVISVAAVGVDGQRAAYSNFGTGVTIAAPGGDPGRDTLVLSLGDSGETFPANDGSVMAKPGTSMAAPHVAGVASLMLSVNPSLTPADIKSLLQSTARAFPTGTGRDCTTALCGAGIVNAGSAVRAAANATAGVTAAIPQSGVWWNPAENGRGFVIEIRDGLLNFGGYLYDASGRASWVSSGPGPMQSATRYSGAIDIYSGGQTLNGPHKSPTGRTSAGNLTLDFTSQTTATLTWPGGTVALQRFRFGSANTVNTGFAPESGVWWNPQEPGRGFALEVQNGVLAFTGFMYDDSGNPVWHMAAGAMSSPTTFNGTFAQFGNGQTLTGPYRAPTVANSNLGSVSVRFIDTANAVVTLPNGRSMTIEKFRISAGAPGVVLPLNQVLTARLLGVWSIEYRIISRWVDYYLFNAVRESTNEPGTYYAWGINQYDNLAVGRWSPSLNQYAILSGGLLFDEFYVFDMPSATQLTGCYYLVYQNPTRFSACYTLAGIKLAEVTPLDSTSISIRPQMEAEERASRIALEASSAEASGQAHDRPQTYNPVLARKPEVNALLQSVEALRAQRARR